MTSEFGILILYRVWASKAWRESFRESQSPRNQSPQSQSPMSQNQSLQSQSKNRHPHRSASQKNIMNNIAKSLKKQEEGR